LRRWATDAGGHDNRISFEDDAVVDELINRE
jgi:hypothetical protein